MWAAELSCIFILFGVTAGGGGWEPLGQPYFDNSTKREATAAVGQPAYLHCRVRNLADRAVSWIRKRDLHILTVGVHTYSSDARFAALHADGSDEWTLRVAPAQPRDSGVYECQVSTEPKISLSFRLTVVGHCKDFAVQVERGFEREGRGPEGPEGLKGLEAAGKDEAGDPASSFPSASQNFMVKINLTLTLIHPVSKAEILSGPELFVRAGSDINLTCVAKFAPDPPSFIYWYRGEQVVNYAQRGGISVETEQKTRTSRLLIARASPHDSGNYTCAPSSSESASVIVHVLSGERPAAMQSSSPASLRSNPTLWATIGTVSSLFQRQRSWFHLCTFFILYFMSVPITCGIIYVTVNIQAVLRYMDNLDMRSWR